LRDIKTLNNLLINSTGIFQIDDEIKNKRVRFYFCLDDQLENENDSIFNYLLSIKDDLPLNCLFCLQLIGKFISKHQIIFNYFSNYSNVNINFDIFFYYSIFYFLFFILYLNSLNIIKKNIVKILEFDLDILFPKRYFW